MSDVMVACYVCKETTFDCSSIDGKCLELWKSGEFLQALIVNFSIR